VITMQNNTAIRVQKQDVWKGHSYLVYIRTEQGYFTSVASVTVDDAPTINWSGMGSKTAAFATAFRDAIGVGLELMDPQQGPQVAARYAFSGDEMIG
jgi:hypothetical protein